MESKFVFRNVTPLYVDEQTDDYEFKLIRGEEVLALGLSAAGNRTEVDWRGRTGWIRTSHLVDSAMCELYFLDVGQGDATFIITPGRKKIMIDGGKSLHALQFLMWKYRLDLPNPDPVTLDLVVLSHGDEDHIAGLTKLIEHPSINVGEVIHNGMASFRADADKATPLGDTAEAGGITYLVDRYTSRTALVNARSLFSDRFKEFVAALDTHQVTYTAAHADTGTINVGDPAVNLRVVAPATEQVNGAVAFRSFGSKGKTINGHSVVLRLEHGAITYLFTGDVNKRAGKYLESLPATRSALDAHVLKAPHHGSHDFDRRFLKAINPQVSVVSSGEEPDYGHPRAPFMAEIGKYSRSDPLLFSTELAATFKEAETESPDAQVAALDLNDPGALGTARTLWMKRLSGIINVRSDDSRIFAARRVTQGWQWNTYRLQPRSRSLQYGPDDSGVPAATGGGPLVQARSTRASENLLATRRDPLSPG